MNFEVQYEQVKNQLSEKLALSFIHKIYIYILYAKNIIRKGYKLYIHTSIWKKLVTVCMSLFVNLNSLYEIQDKI